MQAADSKSTGAGGRAPASAAGSPRIVQFGLRYSPNLGDGVISECLAYAIGEVAPGAAFDAVDLSARSGFGATVVRNRRLALRVLTVLPRGLRQALVAKKLGKVLDRAEPLWRDAVAGADLVLIGGGQLFSDADLNFPLKVARAADVCAGAGVPVVVYAAGVAENWSPRGAALFARIAQSELLTVGLRDAQSCAAWRAQMPADAPEPVLMRDPGVLARPCYGPVTPDDRIGLCISDPGILRYHAEDDGASTPFLALARVLMAQGHRLRLFCNGAEEDARAQADIATSLAPDIAAGRAEVAEVPTRPQAMAHLIGGCAAVVAHRLHACIVAYSYRRPVVGLGWDRKVESFFDSVGLRDAFAAPGTPADTIADKLAAALATGPDAARADATEAEALDGVRRALGDVLHPGRAPDRSTRDRPSG